MAQLSARSTAACGQHEIDLPECSKEATLEILVEAMGHINFTIAMESDRKGIYGDVKLGEITA